MVARRARLKWNLAAGAAHQDEGEGGKQRNGRQDGSHDENAGTAIGFALEAGLFVELKRAPALQFVELDALRDDAGLFELFFGGGRGGRTVATFQAHFDHADSEDLAGFKDGFVDFLAINEGAVGGAEVFNNDLATALQNLAVVA